MNCSRYGPSVNERDPLAVRGVDHMGVLRHAMAPPIAVFFWRRQCRCGRGSIMAPRRFFFQFEVEPMSLSLSSYREPRLRRPEDILKQRGTYEDVIARYERYLRKSPNPASDGKLLDQLVPIVSDPRTLRDALDRLLDHGEAAPGPDGITYGELLNWPLLREIGAALLDGSYRPGPVDLVEVQKRSGAGTRTLTLANTHDRLVQKAMQLVADPFLDRTFASDSFGGRPNRHRPVWMALARALRLIEQGRTLLISQDIRNAFDNVPLRRLMDILAGRIPSPRFVGLVQSAVFGGRKKGLAQGSPLSPTLTNLYLDHFLDRPWSADHPHVPQFRYIDDLLVLCDPKNDDPLEIHDELERLVSSAGMPLKRSRDEAICDLTQRPCVWLGFELSVADGGRAVVKATDRFGELRESLMRAHAKDNSPARAKQVIRQVVEHDGPCYGVCDRKAVYEAIREVCRELAFEEFLPGYRLFDRRWKGAFEKWREVAEREGYVVGRRKPRKRVTSARRAPASSRRAKVPF